MEAVVWAERMLAALGNGVKGGKCSHEVANAFFAERGLFTIREALILACQSRWGNHRLESRVRENRMHGSEGGEGLLFPTPILPVSK